MPAKKLKNLSEITLTSKMKGSIPSGFKSGDSEEELMVVEPLIRHPEISGLYRAIDPTTGWKGWVEYTPPTPPTPTPVEPTPEQITEQANAKILAQKRSDYRDKLDKLKKQKELVDLGVIPDSDLDTLRAEVKTMATDLGEL